MPLIWSNPDHFSFSWIFQQLPLFETWESELETTAAGLRPSQIRSKLLLKYIGSQEQGVEGIQQQPRQQ
jgi:hypothetical protein